MAKRERKGFQPSIASSADQDKMEELARQLREEKEQQPKPKPKVDESATVRITIDIPVGFHADLKRATKMMGQTLKGYFLYLARQDMERKRERGEL